METPIFEYMVSATEKFPRVSRTRNIEASVAGRSNLETFPVNLIINDKITENYIEFRIPWTTRQFLDLSLLALEVSTSVMRSDGTSLAETVHVTLVNGLSNTMFKSCVCYLN